MATVHDVLFDHGVCPGFPKFWQVWIHDKSTVTRIEPVSPNLAQQHFVDDPTKKTFERASHGWEAVVVGNTGGISHAGQLVPVCFIQLLLAFKASKVVPFSIKLRDKIVKVSQMSSLFVVEFGIVGDVDRRLGRRRRQLRD